MLNEISNNLKPLYYSEKLNIAENQFVTVQLYEKRGDNFFDVVLHIDNKAIFLGRFMEEYFKIRVAYKDNKILIYYNNVGQKDFNGDIKIIKVLGLYNILEDVFYSLKEEEALKVFDNSIDTSSLIEKDNYIIRSDAVKKKILK